MTTIAAAPSLTPDALPAVTVPFSRRNAGRNCPSFSVVVPARGCSSTSTSRLPRLSVTSTGTIRSEEHTSELSHAKISYAVFCLIKKTKKQSQKHTEKLSEHSACRVPHTHGH